MRLDFGLPLAYYDDTMTDLSELIRRLRQSAKMLRTEPSIGFWHSQVADKAADELEAINQQAKDFSIEIVGLTEKLINRKAEIERLTKALDAIRFATGDMPDEWNDERSWYKSRFYDCVATAARALKYLK